jgi:hypothetical protein
MSIKKLVTTATVIAALAGTNLATLTTAAEAHDWDRGYGYRHEARHGWRADRSWRHARAWDRYRERRENRHEGRAIALGITALVIGAMIASAANEHEHRGYRRYRD